MNRLQVKPKSDDLTLRNNDLENHKKRFWLYVLKLESDKYYVGITTKHNPQDRIRQHISGYYGARWTKKYKPTETLETIDLGNVSQEEAEREEKKLTLKYMNDFGYQNVRGADLSYSGDYIKRFNRLFIKDDWEIITVLVFLMLAILYLVLDKYGVF